MLSSCTTSKSKVILGRWRVINSVLEKAYIDKKDIATMEFFENGIYTYRYNGYCPEEYCQQRYRFISDDRLALIMEDREHIFTIEVKQDAVRLIHERDLNSIDPQILLRLK
jgi:hypothetical protein